MTHKYKILVDLKRTDLHSTIDKTFEIDKDIQLQINIDILHDVLTIYFKFSRYKSVGTILRRNIEILEYKKSFDTNDFDEALSNICRVYVFDSSYTDDKFMIKLYDKDVINQAKVKAYRKEDFKNDIIFLDFNNKFDLMDLCINTMLQHAEKDMYQLFIEKALYFGYLNANEIINKRNIESVVKSIIRDKVTPLEFMTKNLFDLYILSTTESYSKYYADLHDRLIIEYESVKHLRLKELEKNIILQAL